MGHEVEGIDEIRDDETAAVVDEVAPSPAPVEIERVSVETPATAGGLETTEAQPDAGPGPADKPAARQYRVTDLSSFNVDPDQFFEFGYQDKIRCEA